LKRTKDINLERFKKIKVGHVSLQF